MVDRLSDIIEALEKALPGVTPGPWTHCTGGCECTAILASDHPVADVTKGDWGDDFPSLRFKEGGKGRLEATSVEAHMEQFTYGHVPVETAMRNRAYIALLSPENIRLLLDAIKREPVKVKALNWEQADDSAWLAHGTDMCQYYIRYDKKVAKYLLPGDATGDEDDVQDFTNLIAAKAAAQADYERRIRSALVGVGDDC